MASLESSFTQNGLGVQLHFGSPDPAVNISRLAALRAKKIGSSRRVDNVMVGIDDDNSQELTTELVRSGAEIAGGVTGAAIGVIAGPAGAIGGAAAGVVVSHLLRRIGADIQRRLLGPREHVRVGATLAFAAARIGEQIAAGRAPRQDQFFAIGNTKERGRPPAEELLEGTLLKARDAYEEKKIKPLGNLYANIVFAPDISSVYAGYLLKLAGELTYNQLAALAVGQDIVNKGRLRSRNYRDEASLFDRVGLNGMGLLGEIFDLYQRGLIRGSDGIAWLGLEDVVPTFELQESGVELARLMDLDTSISPEDRVVFYETMRP